MATGIKFFDEMQHDIIVNRTMIKELSKQFDFLRGRVAALYTGMKLDDKPKSKSKSKRGPRTNP